jgi:hypothetical protein
MPTTAPADRRPLIIFLHNMRTGGSTLRTVIARQYSPDAIHLEGPRRHSLSEIDHLRHLDFEKVRAVQGHIPFGLHELIPCESTYVTMLRDPVDRVISLYHYVVNLPDSTIHRQSQAHLRNIDEFVSSGVLMEADNGQTRRLAGMWPDFGQCTSEMLEKAKHNLAHYFSVVGLSERFDESLLLMRRILGWQSVFYFRKMVTADREVREALSADSLAAISKHNSFDLELHRHAAGLLDEAIGRQPPQLRIEVESFQRLNAELAARSARPNEPAGVETTAAQTAESPRLDDPLRAALLDAHADLLARDEARLHEILRLSRRRVRLIKQIDKLRAQLRRARSEIRQMQATRVWRLGSWYWENRARLKALLLRVPGIGSRVSAVGTHVDGERPGKQISDT